MSLVATLHPPLPCAIIRLTIGETSEKNLSTEAITPQARARISHPDALRGRKESAPATSPEGPDPADSLTRRVVLARLRRKRDFERVLKHGSRNSHSGFVLRSFPVPDSLETRLGVMVSKKLGKAVVRNRLRRRIRETCRRSLVAAGTSQGWDLIIIPRPVVASADWGQIHATIMRLLVSAGVIQPCPESA